MSAMNEFAHSVASNGFYKLGIDHLVLYTGEAADVIKEYNGKWGNWHNSSVLWGGYIQEIASSENKKWITVSTSDPGAAFRKWRSKYGGTLTSHFLNITHIDICKGYPGITSDDKREFYLKMLKTIPKEEQLNKDNTLRGAQARVAKPVTLEHHAVYAIPL